MCTFSELELAKYIKHKKTQFHHLNPNGIKKAVSVIGKQPNSDLYVLGPKAIYNADGQQVQEDECNRVWVSDFVSGSGVASVDLICEECIPPTTDSLCQLLDIMPQVFKHNTIPAVLMLGAACMAFHYTQIQATKKCCGVAIAFGPSGTGKTLSLRSALALFGAHNMHLFQHCTLQYFAARCAECSIPFGIDDPTHTKELGELLLSIFGSTKTANISRGFRKPITSPIISANFSLQDKAAR